MPGFFLHNGKFHQENESVISPDNRSFRYGDGVFETIRLQQGHMPLWDLHQDRLFSSLHTLGYPLPGHFTPSLLHDQVQDLAKKNKLTNARVRITIYRGEGGLTDRHDLSPGYIIQTWPLDPTPLINSNGLRIGIFHDARKATDKFSHIKSNNFLAYVQAALHARQQRWNDALVLNCQNNIADSTIANIFWVRDQHIFTPPLSEGPINGVMRRYLLQQLPIHEQPLHPDQLLQADEVFLTNAVRGIQWVFQVDDHVLRSNTQAHSLFRELVLPLFSPTH
jgi:branched-chain amino acid aminotransferase